MWTGLGDFIERLPAIGLKLGFVATVLSGLTMIALSLGVIPTNVLEGKLAEVAPIALTLGVGLVLIGACWRIPEAYRWVRQRKAKLAAEAAEFERLRGNMLFLEERPLLMLYYLMGLPNGRFESLGKNETFNRLYKLDLVQDERPRYVLGGPPTGTMMVAREIWDRREQLRPSMRNALVEHVGESTVLDRPDILFQVVQDIVDAENEQAERERNGWIL